MPLFFVEAGANQLYSAARQLEQEEPTGGEPMGLTSMATLTAGDYLMRGTTRAGKSIAAKFVKL